MNPIRLIYNFISQMFKPRGSIRNYVLCLSLIINVIVMFRLGLMDSSQTHSSAVLLSHHRAFNTRVSKQLASQDKRWSQHHVHPEVGRHPSVAANAMLNDLSALHKNRPPIPSYSGNSRESETTCRKQVHIWEELTREAGDHDCPGLPCNIRLIVDTSFENFRRSDAVVLMPPIPEAHWQWNWTELFAQRPPGQKWIMYSHESPPNTRRVLVPPVEHFKDSYDYSMTYRFRESQLYGSFGRFDIGNAAILQNDTRNWADGGRSRQVAWISSNCDQGSGSYLKWNRTGFVRELSKLADVGMFGKCGTNSSCFGSYHDSRSCGDILRQFKFYLALENTACRDYISEKFWLNAFDHDLVPIVFGPPRSDYEAVAPPHSFIHVQDFKNIRELAEYIRVLDSNDHLYNEYFAWKKLGRVRATMEGWMFKPQQMCQVVERLLIDEKQTKEGVVVKPLQLDYNSWWLDSCIDINEFPIPIN